MHNVMLTNLDRFRILRIHKDGLAASFQEDRQVILEDTLIAAIYKVVLVNKRRQAFTIFLFTVVAVA